MRTASAGLQTLLASRTCEFIVADLVTVTRVDGAVLRFTNFQTDLVVGGNLYKAGPALVDHDTISWKTGLQVDDVTLNIEENGATATLLPDIAAGKWDNAIVAIDRLFMPTPGDASLGTVNLFTGNLGPVPDLGRSHAQLTIQSKLHKLNIMMPRNTYQPQCRWTVFDAGCTLNKAAFAVAGSCATGSTVNMIAAALAPAAGYFDQGRILFTSGANNGLSRTVRQHLKPSGAQLYLYKALPSVPAVSDTFTVYPGCDRTQPTCLNKFSNLSNFVAFPFVPIPETAL